MSRRPQGLKPAFWAGLGGTAEAVPYPKPILETSPSNRRGNCQLLLLYRYRLRQVSRLIYVAASAHGYVIGEQLQRDYLQDRRQFIRRWWNEEDVIGFLGDLFVAFGG